MKFTLIKPALSSIALHVVAFGMLLVSLDLTPTPRQPFVNNAEIIDAVTVDSAQVEQELNVIKEAERQRQQERAEIQRQSDLAAKKDKKQP